MTTKEQFKSIGLDVDELMGNAALEWIAKNTTVDTSDITTLSASAKLFIKKYAEINKSRAGVSSQSIQGLSQSFNGDIKGLLEQYAEELFGDEFTGGRVSFIAATNRWC